MTLRILIYYAKLLNVSLDSLIGEIDFEYQPSALDQEIMDELAELRVEDKKRLL